LVGNRRAGFQLWSLLALRWELVPLLGVGGRRRLLRISLRIEPVEDIKGLVADHFAGVMNGLLGYWPGLGAAGKGLKCQHPDVHGVVVQRKAA
jgi:hypothetical protein